MKIQIINRYTDEVIYKTEAENLKEAVEKAVKEKFDLRKADLNAIFYNTKVTAEQKKLICDSDLFNVE